MGWVSVVNPVTFSISNFEAVNVAFEVHNLQGIILHLIRETAFKESLQYLRHVYSLGNFQIIILV